jgi:hypothetical protein
MRIVNTSTKEAIVSMPRVGTWTLVKFFRNLNPADSNWVHYDEKEGFMYDIDPANPDSFKNKMAYDGWKITVVLRDPWQRYVSGVCEVLFGGAATGFFPTRASNDKDFARAKLSYEKQTDTELKIFYVSDALRADYNFVRGTLENMYTFCNYDISLNENMHTRNWLDNVARAAASGNIQVVDITSLEQYLKQQWPETHFDSYNVTPSGLKNNVERALSDMIIHDKIFRNRVEEYLDGEINRYRNLFFYKVK